MSKKSLKRQIAESEVRRSQKLLYKLDLLGAAYAQAVGTDPRNTCLIVEELPPGEQIKTGRQIKYHFTHHEPKINDQTAHPDVKFLMTSSMALVDAYKSKDNAAIDEILGELALFMQRYEEGADEVQSESGSVVQDAERT